MSDLTTLRDIVGLGNQASPISDSALVIIDAQNTYREGVMKLDGVEPALQECKALLERFRAAGRPVFHIQHDAGAGSPYDLTAPIGQIADVVAPVDGEPVITKNYPNSFTQTNLDDQLKAAGVQNLILAGFMSPYVRELHRPGRLLAGLQPHGGCRSHRYPFLAVPGVWQSRALGAGAGSRLGCAVRSSLGGGTVGS